LLGHSIKSQNR